MSILFVVAEKIPIRSYWYDTLTQDGHKVVTIPRGEQMLDMLKTEQPDLVLMELSSAYDDEISVLKRMPKAKGERVPVVMLTSNLTAALEREAYKAGAIEIIPKQINTEGLRNKINKILAAKSRLLEDNFVPKNEKILIVDDEENICTLLNEFYTSKGFHVLLANSGEEAISIVENHRPNVILLDISMPGMDGLLTLQKIREIDADVGVVMATGIQDDKLVDEAIALGAYHYVLKPFDLQYLGLVVLNRLMIAA